MPSIITEQQQHIDSGGTPIVNGYIHIGARNTDPKLIGNKITIYSDSDLGTPLANPQRTDAYGRAVNKIYVPGKYSIAVTDSEAAQKFIDLDAGELPSTGITQLTNIQGTDTIIADGAPAIDLLVDKQAYIFQAVGANTGAVTLQIDLTAQKAIKKQHDQALVAGDLETNQIMYVVYNELDDWFEMVTPPLILSATDFNVSNDLTVGNDLTVTNNVIITGDVDAATGTIDTLTTTIADTSTDPSHIYVETATDGVFRPQAKADFKTNLNIPDFIYTGFDITIASVSSSMTLSVSTSAHDISFKPDGTIMYVLSTITDSVYQYSLTIPWDITTATYTTKNILTTSLIAALSTPCGMDFSVDGDKCYIVNLISPILYELDLATPWDITTATDSGNTLDVGATDSSAGTCKFSPDGLKMFYLASTVDGIYLFNLSTAWDVSSGSYSGTSKAVAGTQPAGMSISTDGTVIFMMELSTDTIHKYEMSTAWDLSTMGTSVGSHSVTTEYTSPRAVCLSTNGGLAYVGGEAGSTITAYNIGSVIVP